LVGGNGILGAALSGAGPAVLVVVEGEKVLEEASTAIQNALVGSSQSAELLVCSFEESGVAQSVFCGDFPRPHAG
jgi:homoserine kinase